ncbi:hypothetical protein [Micromonospora purpureochromogenes]|uniref:Uncharacterized protein n=1 Tax=Micromonospora purpureochromogenes TaxID=47872 RepID=A0ABX2RUV7_9ACTN|nr:hypothetical protein [Micromonospora purpureochromogenes]NYF60001.1 hypothetical protein [Micromonospora purpureochromogenes]
MIGGESLGDGEDADTGEKLGEDSPDDRGRLLVWGETFEAFAVGSLGGVGQGRYGS